MRRLDEVLSLKQPFALRRVRDASGQLQAATVNSAAHLVGRTWSMYRVSPLYSMRTDEASLEAMGRQLTAQLKTIADGSMEIGDMTTGVKEEADMISDGRLLAKISRVSGLGDDNSHQEMMEMLRQADETGSVTNSIRSSVGPCTSAVADALAITVLRLPMDPEEIAEREGADDEDLLRRRALGTRSRQTEDVWVRNQREAKRQEAAKVAAAILTVVLVAVTDETRPLHPRVDPNFTHLPLMLVKGPKRIAQEVSLWLRRHYDCSVSLMRVPPTELSWLAFNSVRWLVDPSDAGGLPPTAPRAPYEFVFGLPDSVSKAGLSELSVSVDPRALHALYLNIVGAAQGTDASDAECADALLRAVLDHIFHHMHINVTALTLVRVSTQYAPLTRNLTMPY